MPGLFGIIGKDESNIEKIDIMKKEMSYESFYNHGSYSDTELGLYTGWTCHKDSFCDCMPIYNKTKEIILFFFGENFVDKDSLNELTKKYKHLKENNAGYIINLYEEKREDFVYDLNGWFHGLLIDKENQSVFLFNDIYGMQRMYYYEDKNSFIFSSEIKSILKIRSDLRNIDDKNLAEWISCESVLENKTLFKDISLLPGGSIWQYRNGSLRKRQYFSFVDFEQQSSLDNMKFYDELRELFRRILPKYTEPKGEVGMSVTGGLDTRMILSNFDINKQQIPFYTFSGIYRENYDVKIARKIANVLDQEFHVLDIGNDFLANFPDLLEKSIFISDGNMDVSGAVELYANRMARQISKIRLTGNHGSELFRDVRFLRGFSQDKQLFNPDFGPYLDEAIETYKRIAIASTVTFNIFYEAPWYAFNRLSIEQSQSTLRSPYMDKELVALFYRANNEVRKNKLVSLKLISDGNKALSKINTDRGLNINHNRITASLVESYYKSSFKFEYIYNYGMPQWLAKIDYFTRILHLDRLFLGWHKFYHFRVWFRDQLAPYIKQILFDDRTLSRPLWNADRIKYIVSRHLEGTGNYTSEISKILTIELTHRLFVDN